MYEVIKQYGVDYILGLIKSGKKHHVLAGYNVKVSSERLKNFTKNGVKCATCRKVGIYFNLERPINSENQTPHLNLYSKDGSMLTADHDVLKSDGGRNHSDNYNVLCQQCNKQRGNKFKRFIDFYNYKVLHDVPDGYVTSKERKRVKRGIKESKCDNHVDDYYKMLKSEVVQNHVIEFYNFLKLERKMLDKYKNEISTKSTRNISKFDESTSIINMIVLSNGLKISSVQRTLDDTKEIIYPVKILVNTVDGDVLVRKVAWNYAQYLELDITNDIKLIEKIWDTAPSDQKYVF